MADKEKQIEEMAKCCTFYSNGECCADMTDICDCNLMCVFFGAFANLTMAGYRKERQGEWKYTSQSGFGMKGYMFCSECDVMLHTCDDNYYCLDKLNYCPVCGAWMKGAD